MTTEAATQQVEFIEKMVMHLPTLRAAAGLTQQQLGKKAGMSRQTITAIENGKRPMTWSVYLALSIVFEQYESARQMMESFALFDEKFVKLKL